MDDDREQWPALEAALDDEAAGGAGGAGSADGGGEAVATVANLRGILARHTRRRRRLTTGIAASVLAIGLGGGVAIGEVVASGGQLVAEGSAPSTTSLAPRSSASVAAPRPASAPPPASEANGATYGSSSSGLQYTYGPAALAPPAVKLAPVSAAGTSSTSADCTIEGCLNGAFDSRLAKIFDRSANGVEVRAFSVSYPVVSPLHGAEDVIPACFASEQLLVEVSDGGAIGQVYVPSARAAKSVIGYVEDQVVGAEEGAPMAVVAVKVGSGVTSVSASFTSGAEDEMAVVDGWAVLATTLAPGASARAAGAQIEALDSSGRIAARANIDEAPGYAAPAFCVPPLHGERPLPASASK
jgi:hypothetical protein